MKEIIVLDFDGTIVDFSKRSYLCYCHCLESMGIAKPLDFSSYWNSKRSKIDMAEILAIDSCRISEFHELWMATIENSTSLAHDTLFFGVKNWLNIASRKYDLFLLTKRRFETNLLSELDQLGIRELFQRVLVASEHGTTKAMKLSCQPDYKQLQILFWIGDSEDDILSAERLGIPSIGLTSGIRNCDLIKMYSPNKMLNYLTELQID